MLSGSASEALEVGARWQMPSSEGLTGTRGRGALRRGPRRLTEGRLRRPRCVSGRRGGVPAPGRGVRGRQRHPSGTPRCLLRPGLTRLVVSFLGTGSESLGRGEAHSVDVLRSSHSALCTQTDMQKALGPSQRPAQRHLSVLPGRPHEDQAPRSGSPSNSALVSVS